VQSCSQVITTNKPTPNLLQAGCPSCCPTNSVDAPFFCLYVSVHICVCLRVYQLAGIVIGKSGQRIRQVRLDSGADVELSDAAGGTTDRIITITGTLQQIQAAQYMMQMAYVSQ